MRDKVWNTRFLDLASTVATWSKDPSTKVGAVVVNTMKQVVGLGYNGFPRGVHDNADRYEERLVKYKLIVHAEVNAIMNAVMQVGGCYLYSTMFPCSECTKIIIQSGIAGVAAPEPRVDGVWDEDAHYSIQMLKEAGVAIL